VVPTESSSVVSEACHSLPQWIPMPLVTWTPSRLIRTPRGLSESVGQRSPADPHESGLVAPSAQRCQHLPQGPQEDRCGYQKTIAGRGLASYSPDLHKGSMTFLRLAKRLQRLWTRSDTLATNVESLFPARQSFNNTYCIELKRSFT